MHHPGGDFTDLQGARGRDRIDIGSTDVVLIYFIYTIADRRRREEVVPIRIAIGDHGCGGSDHWATSPGIEAEAGVPGDCFEAFGSVFCIPFNPCAGKNVKFARIWEEEMKCTYLSKN